MSASAIIAKMTRYWNRDPTVVAAGDPLVGVSAALWASDSDCAQEICAEPDRTHHILIVQFRAFSAEWRLDGKMKYDGGFRVGDVSLAPAGTWPSAVMQGAYRCLHIYLPESLVARCVETDAAISRRGDVALIAPGKTRDTFIERVACEMLREAGEERPLSRLRIDTLGQDLAIHVLRTHSNLGKTGGASERRVLGRLAPWQVARVRDRLAAALDDDVALADLAALVGLSPYHFARAFKESMGLPPHRYQMKLRVERAKELFASTGLSVTEIAHACGFASSQHMATVFRRIVGKTPSAYRREATL